MKVVVSVQAKAASSRGLAHYIAHSKIDAGRESASREIFNDYADEITVEKANDFLKKGTSVKRPLNEELHHLVISLKAEDYERLGGDEKERRQSLKKITRHALEKLEDAIGADKLNWAAGVHRNTDNPHVHVAIQKEFFDKNLERKTLGKIPPVLLPHYEKNGNEKTFVPGLLIEAATEKLGEIINEKTRIQNHAKQNSRMRGEQNYSADTSRKNAQDSGEKTFNADSTPADKTSQERDVLARAILARFYLEKTRENLESLENHGDLRRFKIYDEITRQKRRMSLFDLERRAEKSANNRIKNLKITDAVKKDELRKNFVEYEIQKNSEGIRRIRTILHNLVTKENQELRKRENDYNRIKPLAEKIRQTCRRENRKLPVPNLSGEELEMRQARSVEKRDVRHANYFERVRIELAAERRNPTRTNEEIERLKALRTLSELKLQLQEKQLKNLSDRKRHFPVEIGGKKWTLSKADSLIEKSKTEKRKIVGKISKVFGKIGLVEQKNSRVQIEEIKVSITQKLDERNEQIEGEIKLEKDIFKTLNEFYKNDTNPEKETTKAKFNAAELAEIESFAFELKLSEVYRENWREQKQFIERFEGFAKNPAESIVESKQKTIAGRAVAREIMGETEVARAKEELALFKKNKDFQKFEIAGKKNGEAKFICLKEVEFDSRGSILDQTLEFFTENREKRRTRNQLEKQVKEKTIELKENIMSARQFQKITAEETLDYKTKSFFGAVKYTRAPLFTPKELITIELRIKQTESKSEAAQLQKILDSADHSKAKNLSAILADFSAEKEVLETIEHSSARERQTVQPLAKNEIKAETNQSDIRETKIRIEYEAARENKTENRNQERGR